MRKLKINNPVIDKNYFTRLSSDYSSGVSLTVENNISFTANDILVVGEPSEELTESKQLTSKTGSTTFTIPTALNFAHGKGTPIYKTPWDYVEIYSQPTSLSAFSTLSQSPIQWDNPQNLTIYFDADATDDYGYKFRFFNSATLKYSEYSPVLTGVGFTRSQVGYMIRQVRLIVQDLVRKIVTDEEIIRFFNNAQDIIYSHNPKYWFLLVDTYKGANPISCIATTSVYSLSSYTTFGHLDSVRYRYTNGAEDMIYHLEKKSNTEFDKLIEDINRQEDDWATCYKLLPGDSSSTNGYIQIYPTSDTTAGKIYPNYYEKMADLDSVEDATQVPLPKLLEDYAIAMVERIKGNEQKAELYEKSLVNKNEDVIPSGLLMLDKMDGYQKRAQIQPKSIWNFRGQKFMTTHYGNRSMSSDYEKEYYMD